MNTELTIVMFHAPESVFGYIKEFPSVSYQASTEDLVEERLREYLSSYIKLLMENKDFNFLIENVKVSKGLNEDK